jgi:RNA polymerase primary sigma factor
MRQLKIAKQITSRETISLSKYLQEVSTISLLTQEEEDTLPGLIKQGDERALKRFVEGNLRFVISVAKQYQGSGERLDDLINAGNEGLIIAAKRFDTSRGFKFISYGVWWIRQSIMQYLTEHNKAIRLPANKIATVNKIKNVTSQLEQRFQRTPTTEEIGIELIEQDLKKEKKTSLKINPADIEDILAASSPLSSLDMKIGEDSESTLIDLIIGEGMEDINATLKQEDLQTSIKRVIGKRLTTRERDVVVLYFGLFGEPQKSLEEIGLQFDLTRERVRQIKEKAIRRLKTSSSTKEIQEYL